jgi:hypothetical protein
MNFSEKLHGKTANLLNAFERTEVYQRVFASSQNQEYLRPFVRRLLYEVGSYGPYITSSIFTSIGRLARYDVDIAPLLQQLIEEVPHPDLALQGFIQLGGNETEARERKLSPPAFALASVCTNLAEHGHPISYLGYLFLLESTTAQLAPLLCERMASVGLEVPFVTAHALEDPTHTASLASELDRIVERKPEVVDAIELGFAYFSAVYPTPLWTYALQTAQQEKTPS